MDLQSIEKEALEELSKLSKIEDLESLYTKVFGRKEGQLTQILRNLSALSSDEKKVVGRDANQLKNSLEEKFSAKRTTLKTAHQNTKIQSVDVDLTLPGRIPLRGHSHPILTAISDITGIFQRIGFDTIEGPEVESDKNNFTELNIPENHPARDMHDTFYLMAKGNHGKDESNKPLLLRTHTSPVQIRFMKQIKPPFKIIAPGRVYRHEAIDATHAAVFHQLEGLVIGPDISFADLKGTLQFFAENYFGEDVKVRFRPSYFPFVEPGAEMDLQYSLGTGKTTGWIEILGAGMVHPQVLRNVGYDPKKYSGFAFGMGVERIVMKRFGVNDIRSILESDMRFLGQFQ